LICSVVGHYVEHSPRLNRVERVLRDFVIEQARQEPTAPGIGAEIGHWLCKAVARRLPKQLMNVLECKVLFVGGGFHHEAWGGSYPAMGYKRGERGMCEIELTPGGGGGEAAFDEMLWDVRGKARREEGQPPLGPMAYRKKVLDDAARRCDRPGDGGDQLHVASDVDRSEPAVDQQDGGTDSPDGGGQAVGRPDAGSLGGDADPAVGG